MRAVFVNHYHPDAPHVGAVRLREFARAMAARNHQVVLLTESLNRSDPAPDPARLPAALAAHDWARPFVLACPPRPCRVLDRTRDGSLARPLRAAVLGGLYLGRGAVFPDWAAGVRPMLAPLAESFRPQMTWATFGNTEAWRIARAVARYAGAPWVMDIKDSWDVFIPAPFRRLVAARFDDAAALTALSNAYLIHGGRRFRAPGKVVHSGLPQALLDRPPPQGAGHRLMLTGSTYGAATLAGMLDGLRRWLDSGRDDVTFTYAGTEAARVAEAAAGLPCTVEIHDFLPLEQLMTLQAEAFINLYCCVDAADRFHHKLLELLAADRPVACLPAEAAEAGRLTAEVGGLLESCTGPEQLAAAIERAWARRDRPVGVSREKLGAFTWEAQAEVLATLFAGLA